MSAQTKVSIDELANVLILTLEAYGDEVNEVVKDEVRAAAKDAAKELRKTSPKKTGEYAKGWKYKTAFESAEDIRMSVYNSTKPQLTHLLEHGHAKVNGGRVEAKVHIAPVKNKTEERLVHKIKVRM